MQHQHYALGGVTDPHPVRPGTSAALTARTIDATQRPPIVRAQEAVAEAIPRVTAPLSSPLFVGTVVLTFLLGWAVIKNRMHVRGFLVSAVLVMLLTSFRPMTHFGSTSVDDRPGVDDNVAPRVEQPEPEPFEAPTPPPPPEPMQMPEMRTYQLTFDTHDLPEPLQQMGLPPEVNVEVTMPTQLMLDREQIRASLRELRIRIREEERRRHRRYYYHE